MFALSGQSVAAERFWGRDAHVPDWPRGEEIDARASSHFLKHYWPKLRPEHARPAAAVPADSSVDEVRVFRTDYWHPIHPDTTVEPGGVIEPVVLHAARGESEPFALGIRVVGRSRTVSLEPTAFSSAGKLLPLTSVSNRLMLPYPARAEPGHRPADMVEQQMVLLKPPENRWVFPANTTMVYVIDFHVPRQQPHGRYFGEIAVMVDDIEVEKIRVSLNILPFNLKTNGFHAGAFGTTYDIWSGGFTGYTEEMMEMDSRYGFNLAGAFFNKGNEIPFVRHSDGSVDVDPADPKFHRFNATMRGLKHFGMGDVAFWNWGASGNVKQFNRVLRAAGFAGIAEPEGKRGFAAICAALKRAEGEYGWPEFVLNPYDEALKDQDATREIIAAVPYVRRASPTTRLYMTEWREGYARLYQSSGTMLSGSQRPRGKETALLKASGEQARLNFDVIGANTLSRAAADLQHRLGGELWHYGGASRLGANARLLYGFVPWIVRAESALMWANYKGDLQGSGWTLHFAMPLDPDGRRNRNTRGPVIPSVQAVAVREGIDDRKYIETLRYYAAVHDSAADLRYLESLAHRVRGLLTNTNRVGGLDNMEASTARASSMARLRAEIRERISALTQASTVPHEEAVGTIQWPGKPVGFRTPHNGEPTAQSGGNYGTPE